MAHPNELAKNQCPKCAAVLKDDYGMVACPKCGSILFIDMDGYAQMNQEEPPAAEPIPTSDTAPVDFGFQPPPIEGLPIEPDTGEFGMNIGAPESSPEENAVPDFAAPDFATPVEETPYMINESEPEPIAAEEPIAEFSMDSFLGQTSEEPLTDATPAEASEEMNPDDPLGLNEFANSEMSQGRDGMILFKIFISGIDSKEIREALRESLTDSRFAWDANRIMSRINKGDLQLDQVAPVKATILVNRIKRLPIEIRWEQILITNS